MPWVIIALIVAIFLFWQAAPSTRRRPGQARLRRLPRRSSSRTRSSSIKYDASSGKITGQFVKGFTQDGHTEFTTQGQENTLPDADIKTLNEHNVGRNYKPRSTDWLATVLVWVVPFALLGLDLVVHRAPRPGPDGRGDEHRALARQGLQHRQTEDDLRRRRGLRRGEGRDHRGRRLLEAAGQVQGDRRAHPEGRAARRSARYRQDAHRARRRR